MSKFHSTVSRRDFMKGLGLAGAGLGAAAATAPVFHDLDEAIASPLAVHKHPWYVKEVAEPTVEIDWNIMKPYDARTMTFNRTGQEIFAKAVGVELGTGFRYLKPYAEAQQKRQKEYADKGYPGYTQKDKAFSGGTGAWGDFSNPGSNHGFLGKRGQPDVGADKWSGTPEEASLMLRAAARYYGAAEISIVQLDPSTTRKLVYAYEFGDSKKYTWADVDRGSESDNERILPNSCRYVISTSVFQGFETTKMGIGWMRYPFGRYVQDAIQTFLKGLGYQGYGPYRYTNNMTANVGLAAVGGMGEQGRHQQLIMPSYHSMMGVASSIITDLPLAPTKPIDAGIRKFCYTCKRCSDVCPGDSLDTATEPTWDIKGPWNHAGYKHWWFWPTCFHFSDISPVDMESCHGAGCMKVCVFSKKNDAAIHDAVKATVATTSAFNGFFLTMDKTFGYSAMDQSKFWDLDLPIMAVDTTIGM